LKVITTINKDVFAGVINKGVSQIAEHLEADVMILIDEYMENLHEAIGTIPGNAPTIMAGSNWTALSMPYGRSKNFWYESGELDGCIAVMLNETPTGMNVVAGVPADSPAYMEAIWNEFGFYPRNSHKLIRRPLFVPLAEELVVKLNEILQERYSNIKLTIRLKVV
jgi:hypothetical protein